MLGSVLINYSVVFKIRCMSQFVGCSAVYAQSYFTLFTQKFYTQSIKIYTKYVYCIYVYSWLTVLFRRGLYSTMFDTHYLKIDGIVCTGSIFSW